MRVLIVILPLTGACTYAEPDCADGYVRNDAGVCKTDGLSASDSGDLSGDTAAPVIPGAQSYDGPIEIGVLADIDGLGPLEDVCEGTVSITVDGADIDGTLSCIFQGTVGGIIGSDPFTGTIVGTADAQGQAEGPLDMELGAFGALAATWSGEVSSSGVDGAFGEDTLISFGALEVPVTYTGTFTAR